MSMTVVLVGHCGPDNSYLRMAVSSADASARVVTANDPAELNHHLDAGARLLLLNRQLGYDFDGLAGLDVITQLRRSHPHVRTMLISNYPEAQADAIVAGAVPGFGKRELGTPRVVQLIREAMECAVKETSRDALGKPRG